VIRFDDYLCEGGQSPESGVAHTNLFSHHARLAENLDVRRKKFPWGELNMLVRPSDSWLLILLHVTHQAENSSVFSCHIKVIHKVTLSFTPEGKPAHHRSNTYLYLHRMCF